MENIKASPAQIDMFSSKIKGSAQELQAILDELRSKLDAMTWDGGDRQQYEIQRAEWTKTVTSLNELLARVGQTVQLAGNNYSNTERTNANMFA
ncbi:MAG TPA: WXG100 family type VII secretion target [Phytomonospora sp.]|uniref:ESAT-6-like protein n=1 Tax=Phytomonospora endophytica TaxID=714109 RepID=A0A841FNW1_9ACTN|nr:WXG100 family type VII secretion target [Phytomonospora endophytica]MBB6037786.1 WXG100 family type VII secretion target [Phytomonospora endophytica]GIG67684.1 hypothetical protein Pen01_39790 [Phytomonospora endophytica]